LKWARTDPGLVFTSSWTDFFLAEVDQETRGQAWDIIRNTPQNTYQILTKRIENVPDMLPDDWGRGWPQVWLGVSVENQEMADLRIPQLLSVPARMRFLSVEPLLGAVTLRYVQHEGLIEINALAGTVGVYRPHAHETSKINWVIVGGESGPDARIMDPRWAIDIKDECGLEGIPFFMKQMGGWPNTRHELEDMPIDLQLREFPV
jgi:protein gp37